MFQLIAGCVLIVSDSSFWMLPGRFSFYETSKAPRPEAIRHLFPLTAQQKTILHSLRGMVMTIHCGGYYDPLELCLPVPLCCCSLARGALGTGTSFLGSSSSKRRRALYFCSYSESLEIFCVLLVVFPFKLHWLKKCLQSLLLFS